MDTNTQTETVAGSDSPDVATLKAGQPADDIDKLREQLNRANREAAERRHALKAAQDALDALKAEQVAAQEKSLAEQGQYQKLYEAEKERAAAEAKRAADLESRMRAQEIAMLRQRVASEKGLPVVLAARLQGETVEEISADADALLEALPRPTAAGLDGGARGASKGMSPSEAKSILTRYNIDPRYLED